MALIPPSSHGFETIGIQVEPHMTRTLLSERDMETSFPYWKRCWKERQNHTHGYDFPWYNAFVMHRQGDILFVKVADLPADLVERKSDILVEGEATGHAHRLTAGQIWQTCQGVLYLRAVAGSKIVHEEHAPIELEPGYWQVIRQREYSPEVIIWVRD